MRRRIYEIVEVAEDGDHASHIFDAIIMVFITLNVVAVVALSMEGVEEHYGKWLHRFELLSVGVFGAEYVARLWSCTVDPAYAHPIWGRLRMARRPMVVIDFLAVAPFLLGFLGVDLVFMRALRLLRLLRVAKLARYLSAMSTFTEVLRSRREELVLVWALMILMLIMASCLMYFVEHPAQPDVFPDIPSTMWWAMATLTTVGYGDAVPITGAGKLLASAVTIFGLALFALPAAIMGSGFMDIMQEQRKPPPCPHCGLTPLDPVRLAPPVQGEHTQVVRAGEPPATPTEDATFDPEPTREPVG